MHVDEMGHVWTDGALNDRQVISDSFAGDDEVDETDLWCH